MQIFVNPDRYWNTLVFPRFLLTNLLKPQSVLTLKTPSCIIYAGSQLESTLAGVPATLSEVMSLCGGASEPLCLFASEYKWTRWSVALRFTSPRATNCRRAEVCGHSNQLRPKKKLKKDGNN